MSSIISEQPQTICPQADQWDPALMSPTLQTFVFCPPWSCIILCGQHHQPQYYNTTVKLFLSTSLARKWSNMRATNSFHLQKKKGKYIFEGYQQWHESIFSKIKNVRAEALQRKDWENKTARNLFPLASRTGRKTNSQMLKLKYPTHPKTPTP